ncbi:Nucleolar protein 12 [Coelomomyces lativittatus]|nr:Nucleolar protein 12 [Coelomomyces lativittatus]KAJ1511062.1 Nucleolar protein 12 [Coelomomyces lativittatus]KAJ1511499.1 Nucleolar protein 12 [Coelomomyces lativittatus]
MDTFDNELDSLYQTRSSLFASQPLPTSASIPPDTPTFLPSSSHASSIPVAPQPTESLQKTIRCTSSAVKSLESGTPHLFRKKYDPATDDRLQRTLFVGNVTIAAAKKPVLTHFKRLFMAYGTVEKIRFRSVSFQEGMPGAWQRKARDSKVARPTMHAYVIMKEVDEANAAKVGLHQKEFENFHLQIDSAEPTLFSAKRSVFVGGLPYELNEEPLREVFQKVGQVDRVRMIRDAKSGLGKGIAYVQFLDKASVQAALKLSGTKIDNQTLRVQPYKKDVVKKTKSDKEAVLQKQLKERKRRINRKNKLKEKGNFKTSSKRKMGVIKKKDIKSKVHLSSSEKIKKVTFEGKNKK